MDAYAEWCLAAGHARSTVTLRRSYLRRLVAEVDPVTTTTADVARWMAGHEWKPETRRSVRVTLSAFFSWLVDHGHRHDNPVARIPPPRVPAPCPHPTADASLARARLAAANGDERLMLEVAVHAGLRRAEIAALRGDQVDGDLLYVTGKGQRVRVVPIDAELAEVIRDRGDGWTFPGRFPGTHTTADRVGRILSRLLGPGSTGHGLRHRFASRAYQGTHDILAVQQLLGHSSPATTQRYVAVSLENLRAAVRAAG